LNSEKSYGEVLCYAQSKLANILFTRELARRLKDTKVTVNALHPGVINTELSRHLGKMTILFNNYFVKPFTVLFFKTPKAGAQTTITVGTKINIKMSSTQTYKWIYYSNNSFLFLYIHIILALDPDLENVSGQYFE
jgi:short-subunit dehydrogenase